MKLWQGIVLALIAAWLVVVASKRPFWDDERWVFTDVKTSAATLILAGAPQECSPAPLFYLLLKPWAVNDATLIRSRVISIVSACLVLGLIWRRGGVVPGGLAALSVFLEPLFQFHATEMRPYALWLLLSGFLVVAVLDKARPWVIGAWALAAGAVATGSIGLLLGVGLWIAWTRGWRVSLALAPGLVVALYYALLSGACVNRAQAMQGTFSLWVHPALLRVVPRVLIGPAAPINLALLAALLGAMAWVRKPLRDFSALVVIFGTFSVVTTAAIVWRDYFFDARLFIPLLVARGLLMGAAFSMAWARWRDSPSRRSLS